MPIPPLTTKVTSPQHWRQPSRAFRHPQRQPGHFKNRRRPPTSRWRTLVFIGGTGLVIAGLGSIILLAWAAKDLPNPNRIIDRSVALSTKIYDRTGETVLYDVHGAQRRTLIELADIPDNLKHATLIAEDKNFYGHGGFSLTGILRSVIINVLRGGKAQGGSTLTQQLVKNAILTPEKTYTRKIKEIILSYQIEKKFSKDEILKLYFNEIPYGSTAYGVEAAAQTYFNKRAKDLTLAEAAITAAIPKAPTYYSPYGSNRDQLLARAKYILSGMADAGYITDEDAKNAGVDQVPFAKSRENIIAPHFVMHVREYLTEKYGDLAVEQGGLKVVTTLDLYKQKIADEAVTEFAEKNKAWQANNAALVAIDPKTGQVLTMVGSKDFFDEEIDGQVNVVTRPRQPGSSFKPIVYATAFNQGFTPDTVLYDVNTSFINYDGKDYEPHNYDLKERGPVTTRTALAGSLNIPAVKTIYLSGIDKVIGLAQDLGYTTINDPSRYGLSLVLGGGEVKLLEHANAYAVFAREGEWHPIVSILEVRDKDGNILEEYKKHEKKVLATQVARQINSILSDNSSRAYIFGEKNYLTLPSRPVAAKTGTTNDYHDAWTVGYTPSLVAGVWVGNTRNESMKRGADGSVIAAPIWNRFMSRVLGDTPVESFKEPEPVVTDNPALNGQLASGIKVKIDKSTGKLATNETPDSQTEERVYRQTHNILYYINRDDPQTGAPNHNDPQFTRWEEAVQRWAQANNISSENPPTDYDDVHVSANRPTSRLTAPMANQTITDRTFTAMVSVQAPRGVSRVEYYLDDDRLATVTRAPYSLNVYLANPNIRTGNYTLKATAFDDVDNSASDQLTLAFNLGNLPIALTWLRPSVGATITSALFPFEIKGRVTNPAGVDKIDIFYKDQSGALSYINTVRQFSGDQFSTVWQHQPPPGSYVIVARISNRDGYTYDSDGRDVIIK